jgi:hypothetical protein
MTKKPEPEDRLIKVKQGKEWVEVKLKDINAGDKFRMWEPDGTIIRNNNKYVFTAAGAPYEVTNEYGVETWGIECED